MSSFLISSTVEAMGSPGCDRMRSTVHLPLMSFSDYSHSGSALRAWEEEEDTKPPRGLISVPKHTAPECSLQGVFLPCFDMLLTENSSWLLKKSEAAPPVPPCKALEQCPVINSQGLGLPSGLEGQVEECCLEQVQSMVLGEVLKDIETACILLNITPGRKTVKLPSYCLPIICYNTMLLPPYPVL